MEAIWNSLLQKDFDLVTKKYTLDEKVFAVKIYEDDLQYLRNNIVNITESKHHCNFMEISAAFSKNTDIIDFLLKEFKIDPVTYVGEHNDTLLIKACTFNTNINTIKYMIDVLKINPHHIGKYMANCLHPACRNNTSLDVIKYLIHDVKVDPLQLDSTGDSCLIEACRQNDNPEITKYLIESKLFDIIQQRDADGDNIFVNSIAYRRDDDYTIAKYIIEKTNVSLSNLKRIPIENYKKIIPMITMNHKRLNLLLYVGIREYGIDNLIPVIKTLNPLSIYSEDTRNNADIKDPFDFEFEFQKFVEFVDKLESPITIKINQTDTARHQNQITIDFTKNQDILFEHNKKKYFGNKDIVYKSIILLNDVSSKANDEPIVLSVDDAPEYLINLYIQSCYCEYFMIEKLLPEDFQSFIKLIDQYPTTNLSIDNIELMIVLYMMKHHIKRSEYLDNVTKRYSLKMIYMYLSGKLERSNDRHNYELSSTYHLSSLCDDP